MRHSRRTVATAFLILLLSLAPSSAQKKRSVARLPAPAAPAQPQTATQTRPRLVLVIVVDQFRYDYLERFGDLFTANGLGRLLREGASWANANYDHAPTK